MFMVLSSWLSHCESSPGSCCRATCCLQHICWRQHVACKRGLTVLITSHCRTNGASAVSSKLTGSGSGSACGSTSCRCGCNRCRSVTDSTAAVDDELRHIGQLIDVVWNEMRSVEVQPAKVGVGIEVHCDTLQKLGAEVTTVVCCSVLTKPHTIMRVLVHVACPPRTSCSTRRRHHSKLYTTAFY